LCVLSADVNATLVPYLQEHAAGAAEDLVAECRHLETELERLCLRLQKLKERCSQKMERNLQECLDWLTGLEKRLEYVGIEAGRRSGQLRWYPSWADVVAAGGWQWPVPGSASCTDQRDSVDAA